MKKILNGKLICVYLFFISFLFFVPHAKALDSEGCCEIKKDKETACFNYKKNEATTKNFQEGDCTGSKVGGTADKQKICVDLYYNETDTSIAKDGDFPELGLKCVDRPVKFEQSGNRSGLFSGDCLSSSSGSIKKCISSAFFADVGLPGSKEISTDMGASKNLLLTKVGLVINLVLGTAGIIFLIFIIYAGIQWLIAGDEEKKVSDSKEVIRNAITGLIITMFAYGLSYFIFSALTKASS